MASPETGTGVASIEATYPNTTSTLDQLTALLDKDDTPPAQKKLIEAFITKKVAEMEDGAVDDSALIREAQKLIDTTTTAISQLKAGIEKGRAEMDIPPGSPLGTAFDEAYKYTPEQLRTTIAEQIAATKAILNQTITENTNHPKFQSEMKSAFINQGLFTITGYAENMSEQAGIGFTEDTWQSPTIDTTILNRIEDIVSHIQPGSADEKARLVAISVATSIILRQCANNLGGGWQNWVQNRGGTLGVAAVNLGNGVADIVGGAAGILGSALVITLATGAVMVLGAGYAIKKMGGGAIVSGAINLAKAGASKLGVKAVANAATSAVSGKPSAVAEASVEIDLKNPLHKTAHDAIVRSIYNQQETSNSRPTLALNEKVPVDFVSDIRGTLADAEIMSMYKTRMTRVLNLGNPPLDAGKLQKWRADFARAIEGQNDPSKWNLKAQKAVKSQIGADAVKAQQILRDAANDAKTKTINIGSEKFEVAPADGDLLNEIKTRAEEIEIQEKKKIELTAAKKKLEARLKDEKEYAKAHHDVRRLPADITTKDGEISTAETNMDSHGANHQKTDKSGANKSLDTAALQADPAFKRDKKIYDQRVTEKATLQEELRTAKETMRTIGSKHSNIDRGFVIDTSGNLTNSTTMEKLNSTIGANIGVKEKIRLADAEITRLTGEVDARLTTLHTNHSSIPAKFTPNMDVHINGTPEKVPTISELFGKVVRAAVKK